MESCSAIALSYALRGLAEFAGGTRHPAELSTGALGGAVGLEGFP
jgi:hypothetical protein